MTLSDVDFSAWMQAVHGVEPFPWQSRLLNRVLEQGWPATLKLPTASGKTSVMDVALFALACQLARGTPRTQPLRLAFVVDRRIVVDSAYDRATKIRRALSAESPPAVVAEVAAQFCRVAGDEPLHVALLRGGIYREDRWARQPNQPTIVCSTVDQVGSRLLHRGYGVSPRTWPIHAGLLGTDTLIVLDEAHCSGPFETTLRAVERLRVEAEVPLSLPWGFVTMTATPQGDSEPFELDEEDRTNPVLARRLHARKPLELVRTTAKNDKALVAEIVERTAPLATTGQTVLVVVNRVATARAAQEGLAKALRQQKPAWDVILLTGRTRSLERDALLASHADRLFAGRDRSATADAAPLVVVATQCVEVGADLDADVLVTEVCALDALRQRLGRLDRLGALGEAPAVVVARGDQGWDGSGEPESDPIYGEAAARTFYWLRSLGEDLDGGFERFGVTCEGHDPALDAPTVAVPTLVAPYCDLWVQTGPVPTVSPEPALFLHGRQSSLPEVQLVWRSDLDDDPATWVDTVSLCPPVVGETLAVRLDIARDWLGERLRQDDTADVDAMGSDQPETVDDSIRPCLLWRGPERSDVARKAGALRPGDTVVIPASYGRCDPFGWAPESTEPVVDLAAEARSAARRSPVLRLHPATISAGDGEAVRTLVTLSHDALPEDLEPILDAALADLGERADETRRRAARSLSTDRRRRLLPHPSGRGFVVVGQAGSDGARDFSDEDETSSCLPLAVTLEGHLGDVRDFAERFCRHVGLPKTLVEDIGLAGWIHDVGKADPRFQAWLYDGHRLAALKGPLLAKSGRMPSSLGAMLAARARAGYPAGGRHELLSVRLAESDPGLLDRAHDRDLVLHLVESHHGHCRPYAPVVFDERPLIVRIGLDGHSLEASTATGLEALDAGPSARFFRLLRRYGWWGLSYLEACLRLADHRASEEESKGAMR